MAKKLPKKSGLNAKKNGDSGDAAKPAGKGGPVKKATGKALGAGARTKITAKPKKTRKKPEVRPLRGGIPFICSECYEEFVLPANYSKETVTCPECLHVGKRPAEDFIRTVNLHKAGEKRALSKSLWIAEMLGISALIFLFVISPYSIDMIEEDLRGKLTMGFGGLVVVLAGLLAWSVNQYEKNRWEIYF